MGIATIEAIIEEIAHHLDLIRGWFVEEMFMVLLDLRLHMDK